MRRSKAHPVMTRLSQHLVWVSLLGLLAAGMCYYSVVAGSHFVDSPHNGFFLKNAIDLLDGRVLFRDSFNSYGLLSTVIHVAGTKIWGLRIVALLNVTLVFVVGLGFGVYYLWSKVMPPWAAFLAASLYFVYNYRVHLPWPNYYGTFFTLCVGIILMMWARPPCRRVWLVAAGVAASLVFLTRQTLAPPLIALVALFIFFVPLANRRSRFDQRLLDVVIFAAGLVVAMVPFWGYLYSRAALDDWWIQSVRLIPLWYTPFAQLGDDIPSRLSRFVGVFLGDLPFLTVVASAASLVVVLRLMLKRLSQGEETLSLLAVLSLAMLAQVYPDEGLWRHVLALSLGFGWTVYLLYRLLLTRRFTMLTEHSSLLWMRKPLVPVCVVVALLPIVVPKLTSIYEEVRTALRFEANRVLYFQYMSEPEVFRGMWLPKAQASFYSEIYREIAAFRMQRPDGPVITTNGDVLPLTFVRHNEGFNPMFTVYPSIAWASITRNPAASDDKARRQSLLAEGRQNRGFESDTANVLAYPEYWNRYAAFVQDKAPLIISSGEPIAHYVCERKLVFEGPPEVVESQYYFWWSQFSEEPQSVICVPTLDIAATKRSQIQ
jgi:hypothetical protein